jgi:hypothetical protein
MFTFVRWICCASWEVGLLMQAWSDKEFELSEGSALHNVDIWSAAYDENEII